MKNMKTVKTYLVFSKGVFMAFMSFVVWWSWRQCLVCRSWTPASGVGGGSVGSGPASA